MRPPHLKEGVGVEPVGEHEEHEEDVLGRVEVERRCQHGLADLPHSHEIHNQSIS